jgi:hypothetical protein
MTNRDFESCHATSIGESLCLKACARFSLSISVREESPRRSWIPSSTEGLSEDLFASGALLRFIGLKMAHACRASGLGIFLRGTSDRSASPPQFQRFRQDAFGRSQSAPFSESGLISIAIPRSVEVICEAAFFWCKTFTSVNFAAGSRLSPIERFAFSFASSLHVEIPCGVSFLCGSAFVGLVRMVRL